MLRALGLILLVCCSLPAQAALTITAARIWPSEEYTRITLESASPISHDLLLLKNPERLVLDLQDVELGEVLKGLPDKMQADDPYIQQLRMGYFKPGVLRLVIDLKAEVKPSVFVLPPAGEYQHRLVLDIYPVKDPLLAMLEEMNAAPKAPAAAGSAPATPAAGAGGAKPPAQVDRLITVAIDAGHGGEDPGARGPSGTHEKHVTLAIAKKLKALIDAEPNMRGVLTRDDDYFIPLHRRVVKARKLQADLFVSIHADAFTRPEARGSSVFALSERGATSAMGRYLAQKENESDLIGGVSLDVKDPYLARTLLDLSQTATINDSLKLGKAVLGHLGDINTLHKKSVEQAGFAVLKSPDIPSILVETAFISNPEEERMLNDEASQLKMAKAIFAGIKRYFDSNPPLAKSRIALQ